MPDADTQTKNQKRKPRAITHQYFMMNKRTQTINNRTQATVANTRSIFAQRGNLLLSVDLRIKTQIAPTAIPNTIKNTIKPLSDDGVDVVDGGTTSGTFVELAGGVVATTTW